MASTQVFERRVNREALPERPERGSIVSRASLHPHLLSLSRVEQWLASQGSSQEPSYKPSRTTHRTTRPTRTRPEPTPEEQYRLCEQALIDHALDEPGSKRTADRTDGRRRPGSSLPTADFSRPDTPIRTAAILSEPTKQSSKPDPSAPTANFERKRYEPPPPKKYLEKFPGDAERKEARHRKRVEEGGVGVRTGPVEPSPGW